MGTFLFSKEATQLEKDLIKSLKVRDIVSPYPEKKSRHFATLPLVSPPKDPEKRAQKFHTNTASLPRSEYCFWLAENLLHPIRSTTQISVVRFHQWGISAFVSHSQRRFWAHHSVAMLEQCYNHSKQCRNNVVILRWEERNESQNVRSSERWNRGVFICRLCVKNYRDFFQKWKKGEFVMFLFFFRTTTFHAIFQEK